MNALHRAQKYQEGGSWHCPRELVDAQRRAKFAQDDAAAERIARERTERRLSASNGAKTRLRNRIKNGVCPCCTRSFVNLRSHMASQHPSFQPVEPEAAA